MQYKTLPDGSPIPVLGLGTWGIGGRQNPDRSQDEALVARLQETIAMGYTHIDTAEAYGGTHTEELVGQAIADFDRDSLFITTKVRPTNLGYDDVHTALAGSLKRLGVESVDLYLIHWPNPDIPLTETFRALNELVAEGKVKHLGVSNFDLALMQQSIELSDSPIATNQVHYNLLVREPARNGVLEFCQQQGIILTAYSPLKDGILDHPVATAIAEQLGVSTGQVALSWLLAQPEVITIPKSITPAHLEDNLGALAVTLPSEAMAQLNKIA